MNNNLLSDIENDINCDWEDIRRRDYKNSKINFYNDVYEVLDKTIELNLRNREDKGYGKNLIGLYNYLVEYCTIKFDFGRQIGKTEWMKKRATDEDIIIVWREIDKKKLISEGIDEKIILTSYDIKNGSGRGRTFKNVYVDEAYFVFRIITYKDLYTELGKDVLDQTFIFLG